MTTDNSNLAILQRDREPYNLITYHGIEAYRQDGLSIYPHYEVVDQTTEGIDIFQCRMVIDGRARTCLLVEIWEKSYCQKWCPRGFHAAA
jgi:hypothetical protein